VDFAGYQDEIRSGGAKDSYSYGMLKLDGLAHRCSLSSLNPESLCLNHSDQDRTEGETTSLE
jgi:hypothetical protein